MILKKTILCLLIIFVIFPLISVYAGEVKLTTYYPAPYGEYKNIKTTGDTYLATAPDAKVGIGTTNPQRPLHISDVMRLEPRAAAPSNPSNGDIYVNSTDNHVYCYLNGWKQLDN